MIYLMWISDNDDYQNRVFLVILEHEYKDERLKQKSKSFWLSYIIYEYVMVWLNPFESLLKKLLDIS